MPKAKLDHTFCLTAHCRESKKKTDYYDEAVTGFVLECRSTGGKTYYLRYQDLAGRQQQHKIGRWEDISFATAKKAAQRLRSEVTMGGDPAAAKAEAQGRPALRRAGRTAHDRRPAAPALVQHDRGLHAQPHRHPLGSDAPHGHRQPGGRALAGSEARRGARARDGPQDQDDLRAVVRAGRAVGGRRVRQEPRPGGAVEAGGQRPPALPHGGRGHPPHRGGGGVPEQATWPRSSSCSCSPACACRSCCPRAGRTSTSTAARCSCRPRRRGGRATSRSHRLAIDAIDALPRGEFLFPNLARPRRSI